MRFLCSQPIGIILLKCFILIIIDRVADPDPVFLHGSGSGFQNSRFSIRSQFSNQIFRKSFL